MTLDERLEKVRAQLQEFKAAADRLESMYIEAAKELKEIGDAGAPIEAIAVLNKFNFRILKCPTVIGQTEAKKPDSNLN